MRKLLALGLRLSRPRSFELKTIINLRLGVGLTQNDAAAMVGKLAHTMNEVSAAIVAHGDAPVGRLPRGRCVPQVGGVAGRV